MNQFSLLSQVIICIFTAICFICLCYVSFYDFIKKYFTKRIWKETKREFLRKEYGGLKYNSINAEIYSYENHFYAIHEEDIVFGEKRIREEKREIRY